MALVRGRSIKSDYGTSITPVQKEWQIRAAAILTTEYVETDYIDTAEAGSTQLAFLFKFTKGSLSSLESQVWASDNGSDWYQEPIESISADTITEANGTYSRTGDGNFFRLIPVAMRYYKIKVKGTGTVTGSSLQIKVNGRW